MLRSIIAVTTVASLGFTAIQLARVDTQSGAPFGPDRVIRALDDTPGVAPADAARARDVLRARPVDGAAYRVLAQVEDAGGRTDQADALFAIAVARWPRDRTGRAALANRAFAAGNIDAGLGHVDALLRVAPALRTAVLGTLMPYLGDPRIRDGLVQRLATDPPWRGSMVRSLLDAGTPTVHAEALLAALDARIALTPAELQARLDLLDRIGQPGRARALWLDSLSQDDRAVAALVFDGGFERPEVSGGYAWQLSAPAGAAIGYGGAGAFEGRSMLSIQFDGRAVQFAGVRQSIVLEPGRYRLSMAVRNQVTAQRPFVWRLACSAGERVVLAELPVPGSAGDWKQIATVFEVPPACSSQRLQLRHAARSLAERRLSGELLIDAVQVTRSD